MRIFSCEHCQHPVFFENFQCVRCGHVLAYLPDRSAIGSLEPVGGGRWTTYAAGAPGRLYRLCQNYEHENVCNWALPDEDSHTFCLPCRLNHMIPDLRVPGHREAWYAMEVAKRRVVYSLLALKLPLTPKSEDSQRGLAFRFLADANVATAATSPILTGYDEGVITINLAEADDAEREKRRQAMREPYRTLLGHFRHEVGHFYWRQLIFGSAWLNEFRQLFGDDRQDYAQSLAQHYRQGAPADWPNRFISAYASVHPWEDWAETWAHYLHITDTLETASDFELAIRPTGGDGTRVRPRSTRREAERSSFDEMMSQWFTVTHILNNLNRGLGLKDSYPFVLSAMAVEKLRFVHRVCTQHSASRSDIGPIRLPSSCNPL
jgi:hypothetical protein